MAILMCFNWKLLSAPLKLYWFTNPKISLIRTGLGPMLFGLVRVHCTSQNAQLLPLELYSAITATISTLYESDVCPPPLSILPPKQNETLSLLAIKLSVITESVCLTHFKFVWTVNKQDLFIIITQLHQKLLTLFTVKLWHGDACCFSL